MIMNQTPYPISFEQQMSQALVCRYGEEMRQYVFKPDIDVSGLSCLLQIAKTDGTFTENGVEVHTDPDTGECTLVITIPQQATVVKGLNRYSICVYGEIEGEDHLLYSAEGPLWVDDNLITYDMIQSVAEVNGMIFPQDFLTVENLVDIVNYVVAEIIKDDTTSESTTWSSQKISDEIEGHTPDIDVSKEVTGNPIEFNDGANAPIVKCVTEITGSQDLHGYDKPWVGGAGKNKVDLSSYSGTATGYYISVPTNYELTADTTYTLSFDIMCNVEPFVVVVGVCDGSSYKADILSQYNNMSGRVSVTFTPTSAQLENYTKFAFRAPRFGSSTTFTYSLSNIQLELGSTPTAYEPYSNICPITAYTEGEIEVSDGDGNTTTHTTTYPDAIYRGSEDVVNGSVVTEWGMIASYAGETLPGEWISDRDEYVPGTTPTTGAQVAYALATPTSASVTPTNLPIRTLSGYNHIESSTGEMTLEYLTQTYDPIAELIDRSALHVYSTDEKIVGKWVDNKDVYEKTIVNDLALTGSWQNYVSSSDMDTIISVEARCTRDGEDAQMAFSNSEVASWLNRDNYIKVCTPTNSNDWVIHSMTVRYTKV